MTCQAWQGENSTILPLSVHDRETILETSDSWKLADLDVEAFCYAPIPQMFEARCKSNTGGSTVRTRRIIFLVLMTKMKKTFLLTEVLFVFLVLFAR
jgi:hypothetical protein